MAKLSRLASDSTAARVVAQMRDLILQGVFAPAERLVEASLSERLDASRTPIRSALQTLEQQGLVERARGGYVVRTYTAADVAQTLTAQAALEGILARLAAEQGLTRATNDALQECLDEGFRIAALPDGLDDASIAAYAVMNIRFHALIAQAANNEALCRCLDIIEQRPFGAVGSMLQSLMRLPSGRGLIAYTALQHAELVDALRKGLGTHAQGIAEAHRRIALSDFEAVLATHPQAAQVVGLQRLSA